MTRWVNWKSSDTHAVLSNSVQLCGTAKLRVPCSQKRRHSYQENLTVVRCYSLVFWVCKCSPSLPQPPGTWSFTKGLLLLSAHQSWKDSSHNLIFLHLYLDLVWHCSECSGHAKGLHVTVLPSDCCPWLFWCSCSWSAWPECNLSDEKAFNGKSSQNWLNCIILFLLPSFGCTQLSE